MRPQSITWRSTYALIEPWRLVDHQGNINMYLEACIKIGVPSHDLFSLRDVGQTKPDRTIVCLHFCCPTDSQVLQNIFALGRQAQALRAPVPQLGVTFHKTMEDLANIEARRLVEREYDRLKRISLICRKQMKRRTDEQKRGSDRRQELEVSWAKSFLVLLGGREEEADRG